MTEETKKSGSSSAHANHEAYPRLIPFVRIASLVIYAVVIIYFGTTRIPKTALDDLLSHDKILHAVAFGGLSVLAYRCLAYFLPTMANAWILALAAGFSTLVGAVLELLQSMVPYRSMEFADLVADTIGAIGFVLLAKRMRLERTLPLLG